ncbi:unnamed protein product, partial [Iphiclides podalirius]
MKSGDFSRHHTSGSNLGTYLITSKAHKSQSVMPVMHKAWSHWCFTLPKPFVSAPGSAAPVLKADSVNCEHAAIQLTAAAAGQRAGQSLSPAASTAYYAPFDAANGRRRIVKITRDKLYKRFQFFKIDST